MKYEDAKGLFKVIYDTGGLTEDMAENLRKLEDSLDEREGELNRYKEAADKTEESRDEGAEQVADDRAEKLENELNELKRKYAERFNRPDGDTVFEANDEKISRDEDIKISDLFKEVK